MRASPNKITKKSGRCSLWSRTKNINTGMGKTTSVDAEYEGLAANNCCQPQSTMSCWVQACQKKKEASPNKARIEEFSRVHRSH